MTSKSDPIPEIRIPDRGAEFYRCALQVNPHHYNQTYRGQSSDGDAESHARAIVKKAVELNIKVLGITDHNSVSGIAAFREASQNHDIFIFPGFELSSSEGIHLLCLYSPQESESALERYLGEFHIRDPQPSTSISDKSFTDILQIVEDQGGVTIAAHITNKRGLFKVLDGQPRIRAWQDQNLLAAQIPGIIEDLPEGISKIIHNKEPKYLRPNSLDYSIAAINARDVVKEEDLHHHASTCNIKMSDVSIDGLRQAFLDPKSRIRLNPKEGSFNTEPHAELVELSWHGGFLDGITMPLNSNMNVLIGGRGAGKSTVIESIRAALSLNPIGDDSKQIHKGIIRNVLRSGTKISLHVRVHRPQVRNYVIERVLPNSSIVRDEEGELTNLDPEDILPKIEIYGQHEISELTKSPTLLTRLLDRFVQYDESLPTRKEDLSDELQKNRESICSGSTELQQIEDKLATLPNLESMIKRFQDAGIEEKLKEQSLLLTEQQLLDSIPERLQCFIDAHESICQELPIDLTFLSEQSLKDLPGKTILSSANDALIEFEEDLAKVMQDLSKVLSRNDDRMNQIRTEWNHRKQQVMDEYENILRSLQQSKVDGEEYMSLRRKMESLHPHKNRLEVLRNIQKEALAYRQSLLREWEDLQAKEFKILDQVANTVSKKLGNRVKVEVDLKDNRQPLFDLLRNEISGRLDEAFNVLRDFDNFSLPEFVDACRTGAEKLQSVYRFTPKQAQRIAEANHEIFMKIEELSLQPITTISLNLSRNRKKDAWQKLDDLSTGQKATAVLLLLLLESNSPLIIDQPEDDLDNRFITEGIIPRIRDQKHTRQFIFSTHNANIPVLGDAEMIIGLGGSNESSSNTSRLDDRHMGSIDYPPIRGLVEEILEGGKEAFEIRRRKYGF